MAMRVTLKRKQMLIVCSNVVKCIYKCMYVLFCDSKYLITAISSELVVEQVLYFFEKTPPSNSPYPQIVAA